jgi:hypothetical protein
MTADVEMPNPQTSEPEFDKISNLPALPPKNNARFPTVNPLQSVTIVDDDVAPISSDMQETANKTAAGLNKKSKASEITESAANSDVVHDTKSVEEPMRKDEISEEIEECIDDCYSDSFEEIDADLSASYDVKARALTDTCNGNEAYVKDEGIHSPPGAVTLISTVNETLNDALITESSIVLNSQPLSFTVPDSSHIEVPAQPLLSPASPALAEPTDANSKKKRPKPLNLSKILDTEHEKNQRPDSPAVKLNSTPFSFKAPKKEIQDYILDASTIIKSRLADVLTEEYYNSSPEVFEKLYTSEEEASNGVLETMILTYAGCAQEALDKLFIPYSKYIDSNRSQQRIHKLQPRPLCKSDVVRAVAKDIQSTIDFPEANGENYDCALKVELAAEVKQIGDFETKRVAILEQIEENVWGAIVRETTKAVVTATDQH